MESGEQREYPGENATRLRALGGGVARRFCRNAAKTPTDRTAIQRQIDATDRQIDQLVYKRYGLTDDKVKIVEEGV